MQILLTAATAFEIQPFIQSEKNVDVLITGVGVPAALYHLQKRIHQLDYDVIIQAGIAGAFDSNISLGSVAIVKQDTFGDIGMEEKENFSSIFTTDFTDANEFPYKNGWLVNETDIINSIDLSKLNAITVNKVSDSLLQQQQLIKAFSPQIETMEGAALHYVCLHENVPFIQLRSISNYAGERDKTKWKIKEAVANLNEELKKIIDQLKK